MPTYKRGPGKYLVRIYQAGRALNWIVRGTKAHAENFEARKRVELDAQGPVDERVAPKFSDFCEGRYRLHAEVTLASSTWETRRYAIATLVEFFGEKRLDRITADEVERYQGQRRRAGIGHRRINDDVQLLRTILGYARKKGIPAVIPQTDRLPERATKGRVKVWTEDEVNRLYRGLQEEAPYLLPITVLMVNTGLRKGEALALEWSSVDLDRGLLHIYPNEEWRPKNGKPREVPIGRAALAFLSGPRASDRWVFPREKRRKGIINRYTHWPKVAWNRARRAAGVGGSPHVCRHTYASHFLMQQPDLFLLAQVLGHSHTRVTAIYAHLLPSHLERARDAVYLPAPFMLVPGSGDDPETVSRGKKRKPGR